MSCSMTDREISWSMKSRCDSGICLKLRRTGKFDRLVTRSRSLTDSINWIRARRWRIMVTWPSFSHSFSMSITISIFSECVNLNKSSKMSFSNCSFMILVNMTKFIFKTFLRYSLRSERLCINWVAIVVKNLKALSRSSSPLLKKKLTPNWRRWVKSRAIVWLIVDLSVSIIPFNQNMHLLWEFRAQSLISLSKAILVSEWHIGSNWSKKELKAVSLTKGNFDRTKFISILWVTLRLSFLKF